MKLCGLQKKCVFDCVRRDIKYRVQTPDRMDIGSDLGLALSSLRLRLESLESTVGGRDISLSARAPPARDSAFRMVRRRQAGDFRGSGTDHLMPEYALSIREDKVKLFEFMVVYALPDAVLEKSLITGTHRVSFKRIWEGLCDMGYAGRMWVTHSILSYFNAKETIDHAYLKYKGRDMEKAKEFICRVLRAFLVCVVLYEVHGRNLNVVKAVLTLKKSAEDNSPLIASAYCWPDISSVIMTVFFNACIKYETATDARQKIIDARKIQSMFRVVVSIPDETSVDAWAAGVLRAPT